MGSALVAGSRFSLVGLALLFTLLNACKPLNIDDPAYNYVAHQIAQEPADPYGFAILWWAYPEPANQVLAPPVLPYWWALAVKLFGEHPWLWKLWLLPFSLLFVGALYALFGRFAPGLETPLVWMTVLSPVFLPSLNLMLDIPSLALVLSSLVLFMRACDTDSPALAAVSGLIAGLGMETKYTAFLGPVVLLLYALLLGRARLWTAAAVVAAQCFLCWEFLVALLYGESHFLHAMRDPAEHRKHKPLVLPMLFPLAGGVVGPIALLGLVALGTRKRIIAAAAVSLVVIYSAVFLIGDAVRAWWQTLPFARAVTELTLEPFELEHVLFGSTGLLALVVGALVVGRLLRSQGLPAERRFDWFLVLWLGIEIAGVVVLTPFPAVRRLMGVVIVSMLLAGRLASRYELQRALHRQIWAVTVFGSTLGFGFFLLDWREAWVMEDAAETGARAAQEQSPGTTWFIGHWGLQFYGERAGMIEAVPRLTPASELPNGPREPVPLPRPSLLRKGDVLIWPDDRIHCQAVEVPAEALEHVVTLEWDDPIRAHTVMCFWSGEIPLRHRVGPRRVIHVWKVVKEFSP